MALKLLQVFMLGVIAAAADDVPITWLGPPRTEVPCVVANSERLQLRRHPPPLEAEDSLTRYTSSFVWRRGEQEINPKRVSINGTLDVPRKHNGTNEVYQCSVSQPGGIVLGYPLRVKFASIDKQFSLHPLNTAAKKGQSAVLACNITSSPPARFSWQKDGDSLRQDSRHYIIENQLLITNVNTSDGGLYRCTAENIYVNKSYTSHGGRLMVVEDDHDLAPAFLEVYQETNITGVRGSRVVLACPVVGWPNPKLLWEMTPPGGRTSELESTEEVLVLSSLELDLEGLYTCRVEGHSHLSKSFNVSVAVPPIITLPPKYKEARRASTVRFNCSAEGKPTPTVTWYKDGKLLNLQTGRTRLYNSTDFRYKQLVIGGVTSEDAGIYQCFVGNEAGSLSAWAALNVTGASATSPREVRCAPAAHDAVLLRWAPPPGETVVAYTVQVTLLSDGSTTLGVPYLVPEGTVPLEVSLAPYRFQVRTYSNQVKSVASDLPLGVICQGQGVPITIKVGPNNLTLVSWEEFAEANPTVIEWILQYTDDEKSAERNITLKAEVHRYLWNSYRPYKVRVLGTKTEWLHQNLTLVPWSFTSNVGGPDSGPVNAVPKNVMVTQIMSHSFTVNWTCEEAETSKDSYTFLACIWKSEDKNKCLDSITTSVTFDELEPNTEYEFRVQARNAQNVLGPLSEPYHITTAPEISTQFKGLRAMFVNSSTLQVSWNEPPGQYTVHFSEQLVLPVETWAAVNITGNSVLLHDIKPNQKTFVMVKGHDPAIHSQILTIPPQFKDSNTTTLRYQYLRSGVRVYWTQIGPKTVRYTQNIAVPVENWTVINVTAREVKLTSLNQSLHTYVMVTAAGLQGLSYPTPLHIPPPVIIQSNSNTTLYIAVGVGAGLLLIALLGAALFIWRKKKSRTPLRPRRRNVSSERTEPDEAEMKYTSARLANGGGGRDVGEPLLNGTVHITENPNQSKTPNGKMKGRMYEAFDLSRYEEPDKLETAVDSARAACGSPDAPRPAGSLPKLPAGSLPKLPDNNMNELTRRLDIDNSTIQPTLQPNG